MKKIAEFNSFKKFALKLSAFFAVVFLADLIIGNMLKKFYFSQHAGYEFLTTYSIEKTKADILVFGSSRAATNFNTDIFEKRMGLSGFNAGRIAEPVFYHYAVLKSVLKRYNPKIIILSFDAGNFSKNDAAYDKLSALLPYYEDHPEIHSIVKLKNTFEKLKMVSAIYPYNSLLFQIITGNLSFSKKKYPYTHGIITLKKGFTGTIPTLDYSKEKELDTVKINVYKSFIRSCINSNIPLYIICPPYKINPIGTDLSIIEGQKIAGEYHISFWDYSRDTFYTNKPGLFADYRHLNEKGMDFFSNNIIEKINALK